jgi:MSHA biogenesis protein MshI
LMKWPWSRTESRQRLALRSGDDVFAWVHLEGGTAAQPYRRVLSWGSVPQEGGAFAPPELPSLPAWGVLEPQAYQWLKIDTPQVPTEELKAAARWQIKELVSMHLDDITLDVMHVGDKAHQSLRQLFVVAAANERIAALSAGAARARVELEGVEVWETAVRNLQSLAAERDGLRDRACACLTFAQTQCILTICVGGELFYTRRMDAEDGLGEVAQTAQAQASFEVPLGTEYLPGGEVDLGHQPFWGGTQDSSLIVELHRSLDVWERSWPGLPLSRLYVLAPEHASALATLLQRELGVRSSALELGELFQGLDTAGQPPRSAELWACVPLLGACLRSETVSL